uniref:Uncharacterized protein MANES_11G130100 n=1 Tax=Rhizophora mucronata TaxID=61149 RepID=A0A2P2KMN6_RHIMU
MLRLLKSLELKIRFRFGLLPLIKSELKYHFSDKCLLQIYDPGNFSHIVLLLNADVNDG